MRVNRDLTRITFSALRMWERASMGLDAVELVMEIEEAFDIFLPG